MKKLTSYLATAIVGLAAFAAQTSSAQPSGISITNLVDDATNRLWDLSLLTNELRNLNFSIDRVNHGNTNTVSISYAEDLTQSGQGKLTGSGTNDVTVDDGGASVSFAGKYTASGSVTSAKGVAHLTFMSRVSGLVTLPGDSKQRNVAASASYVVKFDPINDTVTGRQVYHASASGDGSISQSSSLQDGLTVSALGSEIGDGTWTLQLGFADATANKLSGNASVTLNSGQVYPFTFTGTYNPKTQQSKINLKGTDAGKGSMLQVTLQGTDIIKITGRVSGQTVNIKASAGPS